MARTPDFEDPIEIPQFFFTREIYDLMHEFLDTDEEVGQFFELVSHYCLFNEIDFEYAKRCSYEVKDCFDRCVAIMYSGLNKYRWDYYNGKKGAMAIRRNIPQISKE